MISVGFSTGNDWISKIIRFFTRSPASHTFIKFDLYGKEWVIEAGMFGVVIVPMTKWIRTSQLVAMYPLPEAQPEAVVKAMEDLGTPYDFGGLVGFIGPMVAKWFKLKWKNPFSSSKAMVCSDLVIRTLQEIGIEGADQFDPENTTPEDVRLFLKDR